MYPEICRIGPLTVYSYGLMMAIAVMVCTWLLVRDGHQQGYQKDTLVDLVFWLVAGGILGARIFYVIHFWDLFRDNLIGMIRIDQGGLSWQGSVFMGSLAGYVFARRHKLSFFKLLDLCAPYFALGQAIGRIGCFLNGCCYGKFVSWGIYFPVHDAHLHPTQLYSSFGLLMIFFILKRYANKKALQGSVFVLYLILAALWRFGVEFFRADHVELYFGLSIYQVICLMIIGVALYVRARIYRQPR